MAFSYQNYTGDNTTTTFSIPFTYTATSEISVTVDGVAQTGLAFPSASQVTLTSAPASNTLVQVRRTTSLTSRAVDFASGSVLTEEDLDDSNIQTFHAAQEAVDKANDGITLDTDDKWDAQSKVIKNVATPTTNTDGATKAYVDVVAGSASAAANSASQAASSASNAATSATNAATSETNAATSATTATTQASNAATSATTAATNAATSTTQANNAASSATASANSATASANSATAAATSETNASTSETNAATSASNASTSETNAAGSATAAAATFDLFDDAYLGAKSSNPSVDNDGNALQDGALYFDTTNNVMKVYDLGSTTWFQLTPTVTNQTNINTVAGISSEVTAVAGDAADIGTLATDINGSNNIGTVSGAITNVNLVGGSITNVNAVATNMADVNSFANTYFIGTTAPASPTTGDLWFDSNPSVLVMKVYNGSGFVNAGSAVNGTAQRESYIVGTSSGSYTGSTTVFPATYDSGFVDFYLNGVKLYSSDFTATNGTSITLASAATTGDTVDIISFGTFTLASIAANDLTDVYTTGVADGQILQYSGTNSRFEPVTFQGGAGYFVGENGTTGNTSTGLGDIFRVHEAALDTATTIPSNTNALAAGPLTLNAALTVNGTVTVV